jgi:hypothetical protein
MIIDLVVPAGLVAALIVGSLLSVSPWFTPSAELPWPDSALVAFHQSPFSLWMWVLLLWQPVALWHLLFAGLGVATPGAWLTGVRWVDEFGWPAGRLRLAMRALCYTVWPMTLFACLFLPWIDAEGRGLNDRVAGVWPSDRWRT